MGLSLVVLHVSCEKRVAESRTPVSRLGGPFDRQEGFSRIEELGDDSIEVHWLVQVTPFRAAHPLSPPVCTPPHLYFPPLLCESVIMFGWFGMPGHLELLIIAFIILLLFGNRLPQLMRSLGRGVVEFKQGLHGEGDDDLDDSEGSSKSRKADKLNAD